jgi:hypothetical protein
MLAGLGLYLSTGIAIYVYDTETYWCNNDAPQFRTKNEYDVGTGTVYAMFWPVRLLIGDELACEAR